MHKCNIGNSVFFLIKKLNLSKPFNVYAFFLHKRALPLLSGEKYYINIVLRRDLINLL